jgi:hypothetical protein
MAPPDGAAAGDDAVGVTQRELLMEMREDIKGLKTTVDAIASDQAGVERRASMQRPADSIYARVDGHDRDLDRMLAWRNRVDGGAVEASSRASAGYGRGERIRTSDFVLPKHARYQAAPRPDAASIAARSAIARRIRRAARARCEMACFSRGSYWPNVRPPGGSPAGSKIGS